MAISGGLSKYNAWGLLVMRLGLGIMMMVHGRPKLLGGHDLWTKLGGSMVILGVHFAPTFWGLMSVIVETIGGLFVAIGLLFRLACLLLVFNLIVAIAHHFAGGQGIKGASEAIEVGVAFLGLFITGPGRFSISKK